MRLHRPGARSSGTGTRSACSSGMPHRSRCRRHGSRHLRGQGSPPGMAHVVMMRRTGRSGVALRTAFFVISFALGSSTLTKEAASTSCGFFVSSSSKVSRCGSRPPGILSSQRQRKATAKSPLVIFWPHGSVSSAVVHFLKTAVPGSRPAGGGIRDAQRSQPHP